MAAILAIQAVDLLPGNPVSDFLFAQPSFLAGIGRAFDIGGVFDDYNISATPAQADARAIGADWQAVGNALREAMAAADADVGVRQPE